MRNGRGIFVVNLCCCCWFWSSLVCISIFVVWESETGFKIWEKWEEVPVGATSVPQLKWSRWKRRKARKVIIHLPTLYSHPRSTWSVSETLQLIPWRSTQSSSRPITISIKSMSMGLQIQSLYWNLVEGLLCTLLCLPASMSVASHLPTTQSQTGMRSYSGKTSRRIVSNHCGYSIEYSCRKTVRFLW